jgi:hypothetical protein
MYGLHTPGEQALEKALSVYLSTVDLKQYGPPPPDYLPSIDKNNFIDGWFLFLPKKHEIEGFKRFWVLLSFN